ncbi:MAG: hypothetical protein ACRDT8_03335 [Micromonosporaceae bacterium]
MSKRRSTRIALLTAAGMVSAGAIALVAVPASAGTPTVTFEGGCTLLAAKSNPDRTALTTQKTSAIDKTAEVNVVNNLNTAATPYVDGKPVKHSNGETVVVSKGGSATLPFRSGPAELIMVPNCGLLGIDTSLNKEYDDVSIAVREAAPESAPNRGGSGSQPDEAPVAKPDTGNRPDAPAKDPVAKGAVPPDAAKDKGKTDTEEGAKSDEPGKTGADAAPPVAGDDSNDNSDKKDSVAYVPANHNRGSGTMTLTLVAVICLLGVAVAALRTVVMGGRGATRVRSA